MVLAYGMPFVSGSHKVKIPAKNDKVEKITMVATGCTFPNSLPTIGANIDPIRPQILEVLNPVDLLCIKILNYVSIACKALTMVLVGSTSASVLVGFKNFWPWESVPRQRDLYQSEFQINIQGGRKIR